METLRKGTFGKTFRKHNDQMTCFLCIQNMATCVSDGRKAVALKLVSNSSILRFELYLLTSTVDNPA